MSIGKWNKNPRKDEHIYFVKQQLKTDSSSPPQDIIVFNRINPTHARRHYSKLFGVGGGGVGCQNWKYSKCQEMAKFQFSGEGGGCQNWKYSKCQEMAKFQWGGGGFQSKLWSSLVISNLKFFIFGEVGCQNWKYSKCQEMAKFQLGGGGYFRVNFGHLWSSQIWSFSFSGGGCFLVWNSRKGLPGEFGQKFTVWGMCTETCLCITGSLSHTTYVETNNMYNE